MGHETPGSVKVFVVRGMAESGDDWQLVFGEKPTDERIREELWEVMPYEMRHETHGSWSVSEEEVL